MTRSRCAPVVIAVAVAIASCGSVPAAPADGGGAGIPEPNGNLPGFGAVLGSETATYEYVIPVGAGAALDAGTPLSILPRSLTTTVGQTIRIVNEDSRGHSVGPWYVGARETIRQEFTTPGSYEGLCTVHPSGEFVLQVFGR